MVCRQNVDADKMSKGQIVDRQNAEQTKYQTYKTSNGQNVEHIKCRMKVILE